MHKLSGAVLSTTITTDGGVHPCSKISNISINSVLSFKTTTIAPADVSNQNMFANDFYCERSTTVTLATILVEFSPSTQHVVSDFGFQSCSADSIADYRDFNLKKFVGRFSSGRSCAPAINPGLLSFKGVPSIGNTRGCVHIQIYLLGQFQKSNVVVTGFRIIAGVFDDPGHFNNLLGYFRLRSVHEVVLSQNYSYFFC